jgi:hypothetical protein
MTKERPGFVSRLFVIRLPRRSRAKAGVSSFCSRGLFVSWRMVGGALRFFLRGPSLFETLLQNRYEIDHFGRRFFRLRFLFDLFSSGCHFLFDHFHERLTIIVPIFFRIPFCAHAVDQRPGHIHLFFSGLEFLRHMQLSSVGKFLSEMHEFENEHAVFRFHTREILACFYNDFGDADFFALVNASRSST